MTNSRRCYICVCVRENVVTRALRDRSSTGRWFILMALGRNGGVDVIPPPAGHGIRGVRRSEVSTDACEEGCNVYGLIRWGGRRKEEHWTNTAWIANIYLIYFACCVLIVV